MVNQASRPPSTESAAAMIIARWKPCVIVAGTYVAPWRRARTELSFYYVGESGRPFTYIASGTLRRGDLNADGKLDLVTVNEESNNVTVL